MKRPDATTPPATRRGRALWLGMVLAIAACTPAAGPPVIEVDRDACDHCRMLVSDLRFAGAYRLPGEETQVFDDLGCLLDALAEDDSSRASIWVRDFRSEEWLAADQAAFVVGAGVSTPMAGDIIAFGDVAAARERATESQGQVVLDFADLHAARAVGGVHE